jgi:hypothetical protein
VLGAFFLPKLIDDASSMTVPPLIRFSAGGDGDVFSLTVDMGVQI